jgi:short-subunit dehydrogenase
MKNALVTGASGGIGLAITKLLAAEGVRLMLVARSVDRLKKIVTTLPGTDHQFLQADLSLQNDIDALGTHISGQNFDVLINNAGVGLYGRFDEIAIEQQIKMLTLNCNALVTLSYAFLRKAESGAALVNISSVLGFSSFPGAAAYAGTKGLVVRFSESLYYEYKRRGIFVMAMCPGVTATNFHLAAGSSHEDYPGIIVQTPEQVAKETLTALKKRKKPVVISGIMNRGMALSQRFMSRKQVVNMMGRVSPVK